MSYIVSITKSDLPSSDKEAWSYLEELQKNYFNTTNESAQIFLDLLSDLTEKYPCICDLPDDKIDDGVWSDGPLKNNAGKEMMSLGVTFSNVNNVIPFLIQKANKLNLTVFDTQTGQIHRPKQA